VVIRDPVAIFVLACSSSSALDAYQVTYPSHFRKYLPPTNTCFRFDLILRSLFYIFSCLQFNSELVNTAVAALL